MLSSADVSSSKNSHPRRTEIRVSCSTRAGPVNALSWGIGVIDMATFYQTGLREDRSASKSDTGGCQLQLGETSVALPAARPTAAAKAPTAAAEASAAKSPATAPPTATAAPKQAGGDT